MQLVRPTETAAYDADHFVAVPILSGTHSNVRMIRLSPGQALPPHTHGTSDLFLYVAEGAGELDTPNGPVPLAAGDLAQYRGDLQRGATKVELVAQLKRVLRAICNAGDARFIRLHLILEESFQVSYDSDGSELNDEG